MRNKFGFTPREDYRGYNGFLHRNFIRACNRDNFEQAKKYLDQFPEAKRRETIQQDDGYFFFLLIQNQKTEMISNILSGENQEEKALMQNKLNETLAYNLKKAVQTGNLSLIQTCLETFPGEETQKHLDGVLRQNNYAMLESIDGRKHPEVEAYFLSRDDTHEAMTEIAGLNMPDILIEAVEKPKPSNNSKKVPTCFSRFKEQLDALCKGRQTTKVYPGTQEKDDKETDSQDSDSPTSRF